MSTCPFCHRRLLSQASSCCNWCGHEIPDANYQQRAEAKREAFFIEQALHDAVSLARIESLDVNPLLTPLDPLTNMPFPRASPSRPRPGTAPPAPAFGRSFPAGPATPPAEATAAEETPSGDTTGDRFRHLEL